MMSPSVVLLTDDEGFGSGVAISTDGKIMTNLHVILSPLPRDVQADQEAPDLVQGLERLHLGPDPRHDGRQIQLARPVETYANCFVKRDRPSWTLSPDAPAPEPAPSALRLRELPGEDGEEGR